MEGVGAAVAEAQEEEETAAAEPAAGNMIRSWFTPTVGQD
jgi:hypothetical protein